MPLPDLVISLTWRTDGRVVLDVQRADGSRTWQVHQGRQAGFFPFHDLTHLAVETVLGTRDAFWGLLAAGWDIADTGGKGPRGPLPREAIVAEHIVGLLDRDRAGGAQPLAAADVNAALRALVAAGHLGSAPSLTNAQMDAVRAERERLHSAWANTPQGEVLRLEYRRPRRGAL